MSRFYSFIAFSFFVILSVNTGFVPADDPFLLECEQQTQDALIQLRATMTDLQAAAKASDISEARRLFHKSRRIYKSSEYLLEYFHHSAIKRSINGAPLPQIEQKVADHNIIPPQGFQRIEEVLYSEVPDFAELNGLAKTFLKSLTPLIKYNERIKIYNYQVVESMRFELIRIYTLGLTGFENPGSDSTMVECLQAFSSLEASAVHYAQRAGKDYPEKIEQLIKEGKARIKNGEFDTFDRLAFLREINDPLFAVLLDLHHDLGFETHQEVNRNAIPTNYEARSLFDPNFFSKQYFLKTPEEAISKERKELGAVLFFDPALSFNNAISCASCHQPDKAFTDGVAKSVSNDLQNTLDRNAPTLINAAYSGAFFHDLRAAKLEMQTEHVMVSPQEFNVRPEVLAEKLKESKDYVDLFQRAFPGMKEPIQPRTIKTALAVYVGSLTSWNSAFDRYVRGETQSIAPEVQRGYNIFMGKASCGTCHFAPNFNGIVPPFYDDTESEVLGVLSSVDSLNPQLDGDIGRRGNGIPSEEFDHLAFSFKTPTIRNVELTGPYFHNGAFNSLEEVMWFYNSGGAQGLGLDLPNQTLPPDSLKLSQREIQDVISFMNSLTDTEALQELPASLPAFDQDANLGDRSVEQY